MLKTLNKFFLITALLFNANASYSSMELWEGDREKSRTVSLISGKQLHFFHTGEGQAAITLGFRPLKNNPKVHHAYLVFETPCIINKKESIKIEGIHLGTKSNSVYDPDSVYGYVYGGNDPMIHIESDADVIKKFFRGKVLKKSLVSSRYSSIPEEIEEYKEEPAQYQKYYTFIVSKGDAFRAIHQINLDKDGDHIKFDIKGFSFLPSWLKSDTYNCTSYAARILRAANINIPKLKGILFYDRPSLVNAIEEYKSELTQIERSKKIFVPRSAQQLKSDNF